MDLPSQLRRGLKAAALWLPLPADGRIEYYYDLAGPLFQILSGDSGLRNIGYETGGRDLAAAQVELCRRTVASLPPAGRWLEVGCGEGAAACTLAAELPRVEVLGIDLHAEAVRLATAHAARSGFGGRVRFRVGDACRLELEGEPPFDGLYAVETACHYTDKPAFARAARRALRPGGRLAIADFVMSPDSEARPDRAMVRWTHQAIGLPPMYTAAQWRGCLEEAGFTDLRCRDITPQTFGCLPLWRDRLAAVRPELERLYPPAMVSWVGLNVEVLIHRLEGGQLRYALVEARS